jgi:hypothetical protein
LQSEFPDLDSEGEETGKDITGTDIESQNQEAEAAADVLPVQIEPLQRTTSRQMVSTFIFRINKCMQKDRKKGTGVKL